MSTSVLNLDAMMANSVKALCLEIYAADKYEYKTGKQWGDLAESTRDSYKRKYKDNVNDYCNGVYQQHCNALYQQYINEGLQFLMNNAPTMFKNKDISTEHHNLTNFSNNSFNPVLMLLEWMDGYDPADADLVIDNAGYELGLTMRCYNKKYIFATDNIFLLEPITIHPKDSRDQLISALDYLFIPAMLYAKYGIISTV